MYSTCKIMEWNNYLYAIVVGYIHALFNPLHMHVHVCHVLWEFVLNSVNLHTVHVGI